MNIKFKPQDQNHPPDRRNNTNIGEHLPGEVVGVSPDQEAEARRLVENGDYVETDEEPNSDEIAANMAKAVKKFETESAKRDTARAEAAAAEASTAPAPATAGPTSKKRSARK